MTTTFLAGRKVSEHPMHVTFHVVATNSLYGQICQNFVRALPVRTRNHVGVSTCGIWQDIAGQAIGQTQSESVLLVSRLADIPEDAKAVGGGSKTRRHLVFVEDMPVEAIPSRIPRLNVRDSRRLHIARETNPDAISAIIKRAITGMAVGPDRSRIIHAWIEGPNLVVLSPSFERLSLSTAALAQYLGNDVESIKSFEIDEDGSYLYWPHADVHLGWEQFRGILDPSTLIGAQERSAAFNVQYGAAIRALRESHGLKQSDIKGITDRHLRRIEHGEIAVSSSVLDSLARAHGLNLSDYLTKLSERV